MSRTTAPLTASTAMLAAARPRRASASRAPSAAKPPPRRRRRALATSAPRSSATVGRAVARHAGQAAAAADHRHDRRAARRPAARASAQPGGCSLSASSRSPAAPRTATAPIGDAQPRRPRRPSASRATRARRRCARARTRSRAARRWPAGGAGRRPRWWPRASSPRRPSAMSEKATSSAMTIPAAESMSTRTPLRVTKRTPRTWVLVARACCRSTSTRPGSAAQMSAWSTGKRCWASRSIHARATYIRGAEASGKATLSGATAIPTTRSDAQPPDAGPRRPRPGARRWPRRAR